MDEIVIRAMQKWPNVPNVFGWLKLDRRGNWLVKSRQSGAGAPAFERITNAAVIDFIGRNYAHDERGRWFFQNGPQRVFVTLEYTPFVYRLRDDGDSIETHTGVAATEVRSAWIDDGGMLVLETELGPGVLLDRDLPRLLDRIETASGRASEESLAALTAGAVPDLTLELGRRRVPLSALAVGEAAARFGFDPAPAPVPGEPEC
ncbi:MAG: DUF2946 family protein [Bacteroidota bacterium]|jgi:hypothetical protein|nr:DUF2946 family protein [Burkholderiales bacterium]